MIGRRFGRLVVTARTKNSPHRKTQWVCKCDCGSEVTVIGQYLRGGNTRSCGCLRKEVTATTKTKHGWKGSPEYDTWVMMKQRCCNPRCKEFKYYGARGIRVCNRWQEFGHFISDMGPKPPGRRISIERKDNNGDYEPGNCCWATPLIQARNRRKSHHS